MLTSWLFWSVSGNDVRNKRIVLEYKKDCLVKEEFVIKVKRKYWMDMQLKTDSFSLTFLVGALLCKAGLLHKSRSRRYRVPDREHSRRQLPSCIFSPQRWPMIHLQFERAAKGRGSAKDIVHHWCKEIWRLNITYA